MGGNVDKVLKKNDKEWIRLYKQLGFREITWKNSPNIQDFWTWTDGHVFSRIDRVYIKNDFMNEIKYTEIIDLTRMISDHKMILTELDLGKRIERENFKTRWKLNEQVLENVEVINKINYFVEQIPSLKKKFKHLWYDRFIHFISNFLKIKSRELSKIKKNEINNIFEKIESLNKNREILKEIEFKEQLNILGKDLENYYENVRKGVQKRQRFAKFNFAKHPTKVLIEKINRNEDSSKIIKYRDKYGIVSKETKNILEGTTEYYKTLMGEDKEDKEKIKNYNFKIKSVKKESEEFYLNAPFTYSEVKEVIDNMEESAPGENGMTIGFFQKFFHLFGNHFVEILNDIENPLPETFNISILKLLPKNKNEIKGDNDIRPISLTNLEYRFNTKCITKRLVKLSNVIFKDFQTCSIRGRRIDDCINIIRDGILDSILSNKELYITSIDQRKAFDSLFHGYLFAMIDHMKFGYFITKNIKRLYSNSYAYVEVNKLISKIKILILRGIKQGCALSMFLYTLCIEELLIRINENLAIKGYPIKMCTIGEMQFKTTAYADDVASLNNELRSIELTFDEFKQWGVISGASINEDKTEILAINSRYKTFRGNKFVDKIKILGIIFDRTGIAKENFIKVKKNFQLSLNIWNNINLNMIERITAIRTFALSKIWYLANFIVLERSEMQEIEKMSFNFIWNNKQELIKRKTLYLDPLEGGLNMVCIWAKLDTIYYRNFLYFFRNRFRPQYQFFVYWMKFHIGKDYLPNFNIIPVGEEKERPKFLTFMINSIQKMKTLYKNWFDDLKRKSESEIGKIKNNMEKTEEEKEKIIKRLINKIEKYKGSYINGSLLMNTKEIYKLFLKKYTEVLKLGGEASNREEEIFENLNNNIKDSKLKIINYKIILNGLGLNKKFRNRYGKICYLCKKEVDEDLEHLFLSCDSIKPCLNFVENILEKKQRINSIDCVRYKRNYSKQDYLVISFYTECIWRIRNIMKHNSEKINLIAVFIKFFNKWLISQTEI